MALDHVESCHDPPPADSNRLLYWKKLSCLQTEKDDCCGPQGGEKKQKYAVKREDVNKRDKMAPRARQASPKLAWHMVCL